MGMDLDGKNPASEVGEHFRANIWWWRPLWAYCREVSPEAASVKYGFTNDGDGLNAADSIKLADTLDAALASGATKEYEQIRRVELSSMPDKTCEFCHGTGKRTDMEVPHGCNVCFGKGTVRPWEDNYPFNEDTVRKFSAFLRDSGGFEIW